MALLTKENDKPMASDVIAPGANEPDDRKPQPRPGGTGGGGYFTIYKSGQGYWTRLGTAVGAILILGFSAYFIWEQLRLWDAFLVNGKPRPGLVWGVVTSFVVVAGLVVWHFTNKPTVVDFLIQTDSEMKKVNWTSRRELIGSTKVVIGFMFLIAAFLFLMDVFFGYLFYFMKVLKTPPF
jgi:preprotein translocase subunit SecE